MKPRNFPGRKHARRTRAAERATNPNTGYNTRGARALADHSIADTRVRAGNAGRYENGVAFRIWNGDRPKNNSNTRI